MLLFGIGFSQIKISTLPAVTLPLSGSEEMPIVQSGVTKKVSVNNIGAKKINISDSAAMLFNYKHWDKGYLKGADTATIRQDINTNSANIVNKWSKNGDAIATGDILGSLNLQPLIFKTNNVPRVIFDEFGKVGIGVMPTAKLDVYGDFRLRNGSQGVDKILASDINGLSNWSNLKTINGTSILGSGNITISGGGIGGSTIDSLSYHYVTQLADSTGFILHRPNGLRDTILVNLGPGLGSYLGVQTGSTNGLSTNTLIQNYTGTTGNPPSAIGAFTGINLAQLPAPTYGGIIGSDQAGNFFTRASNGSTWKTVITDANIGNYAPTGGVQYNGSTANFNSFTSPPNLFSSSGAGSPPSAIGAVVGVSLPHPSVAGYGGLLVSDQEGSFFVRKNNSSSTWKTVITDANIGSYAPTGATVTGYTVESNANNWTGNSMYHGGGSNLPSTATGLTGINYPYANLPNYGNQLAFERYGKLYSRNNNAGSFGQWKTIPQFIEGELIYNPPSIAASSSITTTISLTGANLGDFASCSFSLSLTGIVATAYVSASDVITIVLFNPTASAIDLASGTLKTRVQ